MSTKANIDSLTGLRGLAVMFVIFNHYYVWSAPYPLANAPWWLGTIFGTSNYGMTLFFTLSGFVIAYNYYDFGWKAAPFESLGRFVYLRLSRLYPALAVFFFALAIGKVAPAYASGSLDGLLKVVALHVASIETWLPFKWDGALAIDNIFHVSWSISTEILMYLMFATAVIFAAQSERLAGAAGAKIVAAIIAAYVLFILLVTISPSAFQGFVRIWYVPKETLTDAEARRWFFYMSPYFRVLEFGLGCAAAFVMMYRQSLLNRYRFLLRPAAALSAGLLIALQFRSYFVAGLGNVLTPFTDFFAGLGSWHWSGPGFDLLSAVLFAVIILNGNDSSRINSVLSSRILLFLGEISYSLYLFHPLSPRFGLPPARDFSYALLGAHLLNFVSLMFFAVIFAYGMYVLLEMPAQRALRRLIRRRPLRAVGDNAPVG